ncbi:MAG: LiaF domain-containing protein [Syntrophomonadaceae bacterium]
MFKTNARYLIGLVIIATGIIALLNNFGVTTISLGYLVNLIWPLLLASVGITIIKNRRDLFSVVTGSILIGLGVIFLGRNAGIINIDLAYFWRGFWPVIIILIGISLLSKNQTSNSGNFAIMGSVEKTSPDWKLNSGEYTAIMGSVELDLRMASFAEKEVNLTLTSIMGVIKLILPEDIAVICKGTSIMGGIDVLGKESGGIIGNTNIQIGDCKNASKILDLNCTCVMGGIEIIR